MPHSEELIAVAWGAGARERSAILALHGGPGFDRALFKPFLSALTDTAQVVYRDLRCQGHSGRPPVKRCSPEQMADDVAAICGAVGRERPTMPGHKVWQFAVRDDHLMNEHAFTAPLPSSTSLATVLATLAAGSLPLA